MGAIESVTNVSSSGESSTNTYDYYLNKDIYKETGSHTPVHSYNYDGKGRLTKEGFGDDQIQYTYDDRNNRIKKVQGDEITKYQYDNDNQSISDILKNYHLRISGYYTYAYDASGNQISKRSYKVSTASSSDCDVYVLGSANHSYVYEFNEYDIYNRLIGGVNNEGTYHYDYHMNGLRRSKEVDGEKTKAYWNGDKLILELTDDKYVKNRYSYGMGLVNRYDGTQNRTEYYQYNGQGDVIQLTDEAGSVRKTYRYDAYGNEILDKGNEYEREQKANLYKKNIAILDTQDTNPFRYRGEYYDKETGTYYLRARNYNPRTGRFLNADTYPGKIGSPQSLHLYTYCKNNPVRYRDPSGHREVISDDNNKIVYAKHRAKRTSKVKGTSEGKLPDAYLGDEDYYLKDNFLGPNKTEYHEDLDGTFKKFETFDSYGTSTVNYEAGLGSKTTNSRGVFYHVTGEYSAGAINSLEGNYSMLDVALYNLERSFESSMKLGDLNASASIPTDGVGGSIAYDASIINIETEYSFSLFNIDFTAESRTYVGAGVSAGFVPASDIEISGFDVSYGGGFGLGNSTTIKVRW